jgi:hypothetical protein
MDFTHRHQRQAAPAPPADRSPPLAALTYRLLTSSSRPQPVRWTSSAQKTGLVPVGFAKSQIGGRVFDQQAPAQRLLGPPDIGGSRCPTPRRYRAMAADRPERSRPGPWTKPDARRPAPAPAGRTTPATAPDAPVQPLRRTQRQTDPVTAQRIVAAQPLQGRDARTAGRQIVFAVDLQPRRRLGRGQKCPVDADGADRFPLGREGRRGCELQAHDTQLDLAGLPWPLNGAELPPSFSQVPLAAYFQSWPS